MQSANGNGGAPASATGAAVKEPPSRLPIGRRVIGYVPSRPKPVTARTRTGGRDRGACERAGWKLVEIVSDRESDGLERPALGYALKQIANGQAERPDRQRPAAPEPLDRGPGRADGVVPRRRAALIALDLGIDTSTPRSRGGQTLIALSDCEHERIARRTRSA